MAKILDKILPSVYQRLTRARQSRAWAELEMDALDEELAAKKEARLSKIKVRLNKELSPSALRAANKEEYYSSVVEDKLRAYDIRKYMSHRAVNHGLAKKIFRAVKRGNDYGQLLIEQKAKIDRLNERRRAYIDGLLVQKQESLAKCLTTDTAEYDRLSVELKQRYLDEEKLITQRLDTVYSAKKEKLRGKLAAYDERITNLLKDAPERKQLGDDVLLSVKGLKMYFGGLKAVDDLTFDVKKGEIFGLIGPNGAGKTTVFNCITRFYNATAGEMHFENKQGEVVDLRSFKVHDVIPQGISRTFQNVELVREISVIENLLVACTREYRSNLLIQALGLPILKKEEKLLRAKAMKVLRFMGIEGYANWLAFGLPYGILKKIEIARALMSGAKLIIMDEPAAGLNETETKELADIIKRIRDEFNTTILLVEHDMSLVMGICDTVCAISFGKMLAIGTTAEIQSNKAVQEAYLGVEEDE